MFVLNKNQQKKELFMDKDTSKNVHSNSLLDLFSLSPVCGKAIELSFTSPDLSSQGGLLLLREYEQQRGFIQSICGHIEDHRCSGLVQHSYQEMLTQRIFQIASGCEDADDCDLLRKDSVLKMCCGRTPEGADLSSQPTMSRLENKFAAGRKACRKYHTCLRLSTLWGIMKAFDKK
jgi:hypothetical protein